MVVDDFFKSLTELPSMHPRLILKRAEATAPSRHGLSQFTSSRTPLCATPWNIELYCSHRKTLPKFCATDLH
ncbi:hypothetical protein LshimejAT787_0600250 [Lyophyllum shimeji]|uniref:Uncharacterized protein n=1 Tax=Lyophyllum shimeji TaxID=47721 RepID=A0A9P3PMZ5_LYOSH|nr:hypothetical protein LshimejAT787_0600250 [Lyophyllum shimeji]